MRHKQLVALCQAGVAVTASDAAAVANAKIESYEREAKLIAGLKHVSLLPDRSFNPTVLTVSLAEYHHLRKGIPLR